MNEKMLVNMILSLCKENDELRNELIVGLLGITIPSATIDETPEDDNWYDEFKSDDTTVIVKGSTVQVTVRRGHAADWHDALRSAGFKWSRKSHLWWAYLDDDKRAEVAERNRKNDEATAGMTASEKRAYWHERRSSRKVA